MFIELPGGHIVNTENIVRLKDITGTGHYRVFISDGFTVDVGPDEAAKLKAILIPVPDHTASPKRKPGRPKKKVTD